MMQSLHHRLLSVGAALVLLLAHVSCLGNGISFVTAFSNSPILPSHATTPTFDCHHSAANALCASNSADVELTRPDTDSAKKKVVLVLGGSGYIGRRICKDLVEATSDDETTKVVSISRNGKPQGWSLGIGSDTKDSSSWSEKVEWIQHEIGSESKDGKTSLAEALRSIYEGAAETEPVWETTIVGCIGNVNPNASWEGLWGLNFEDERLLEENGSVYESFLNQTESLRTEGLLTVDRCVLLSLDYTCQKCLEGPIEGYLDGKRLAERRLLEAVSFQHGGEITDPSNLERVVVIGLPNFVYGGKRFPKLGKIYRKFVESPVAKAYVGGNNALRSLSVAEPEDWLEAMLFLSPVHVETTGRAAAMAARGLVTRDLVNNGEPRQQGFFNTSGLPVEYDDVLFVDGTHEIEALVGVLEGGKEAKSMKNSANKATKPSVKSGEPLWEGALIGKRPYLYPFPVASFFIYLFWGIATQKFVETAATMV